EREHCRIMKDVKREAARRKIELLPTAKAIEALKEEPQGSQRDPARNLLGDSLGNRSLMASYTGSACRFPGISARRLQFDRILVVRLGRQFDGNSGAPRIRVLMAELDYSKKRYII